MDTIDPDQLLSQTDVAPRLKVKTKTLEAWRHRGGGPRYVLVGRLVRYRLSDIQAWLAARTVSSTSEEVG
jgi:predicted DNA-binding transcriptional regulator AlpA